jgi:adenine-specific DNA-methyltransferase
MSDGAWKIQDLASEGLPDRVAELAQLFPEAITDGKVDVEKLRLLLGETVEDSPERYGLSWPGKRDAIRLAQKQSTATLDPMATESVDFGTTKNVIIEGDNLEVLKLLQKSYYGKVKLIYIDPPYNTGKDFVYKDDFAEPTEAYLRRSGQADGEGFRTSANREVSGRFHSDWLSMMYPRIVQARNLLSNNGAIFVSIDDVEVADLRLLMDEVFGNENFIAEWIWKSKSGGANDSGYVAVDHEYILAYAKSLGDLEMSGDPGAVATTNYNQKDSKGRFALERLDKQNLQYSPSMDFEIEGPDGVIYALSHKDARKPNAIWRWSKKRIQESMDELVFRDGNVYTKNYEKTSGKPRSLLTEERFGRTRSGKKDQTDLLGSAPLDNAKPVRLIGHIARIMTDKNSVVMDFFSGSGTTGHAVMAQNAADGGTRRFVLVQLPEETDNAEFPKISDITRERVRRAGKKIKDEAGDKAESLDIGFRAFRLAESKFRNWDSETDAFLTEELDFFVDNISSTATDEQVVHEIMLKAGIRLDTDLRRVEIAGEDVYLAMDGLFVTSAARKITQELIDGLLALHPWPAQVALLDAGFGSNDSLKLNARHQFASRRPDSDPDKDNALRTV